MKNRKIPFAGLAFVLVLLVTSTMVEIALRAYASLASSQLADVLSEDPLAVLIEGHGVAGYRPRPETVIAYENGAVARLNATGFRGPSAQPATDVFRVVLLGGSTTFGWGVDDHETVDAYLRPMLQTAYPERAFDVINLAFDGYDSYQLLQRLLSDGLRLRPHVVIVNSGVNDVGNGWYQDLVDGDRRTLLYATTLDRLQREDAKGGPTLWTRTKSNFYLARLPGWVRQEMGRKAERRPAEDRPAFRWDALDYFEANLDRIVDASAPAAVLFSTPPSALLTWEGPEELPERSYWIHDAATTQMYRDSLSGRMRSLAEKRAAEGRAVRYVEHPPLDPSMFLDDAHLTAAGNRLVAGVLFDALQPWLMESPDP